jgi:hypothetical protein
LNIHLSTGELPAVIDFEPFDVRPGEHSFIVIANSTLREVANYTYTFYVNGMETTTMINTLC